VHDIIKKRDAARSHGRKMHEILHDHKTGYRWLDDPSVYRHSVLGDALRRLAQRKENGTDPHLPVIHAHRNASHLRRLSEGIFGASLAAPYALWDTTISSGLIKVPQATDNVFSAALKYVVYSTVGCYFTKPVENIASSSFTDPNDPTKATDGESLKVFRATQEKLCFPAIPVALPPIPKFREWTKSRGLDFSSLTYEEYDCRENLTANLKKCTVPSTHTHASLVVPLSGTALQEGTNRPFLISLASMSPPTPQSGWAYLGFFESRKHRIQSKASLTAPKQTQGAKSSDSYFVLSCV
jgi:hypothetical protein